jgi:hypothetical protein
MLPPAKPSRPVTRRSTNASPCGLPVDARQTSARTKFRVPNRPKQKASCRQDAGQSSGRPRMLAVASQYEGELASSLVCFPGVLSPCVRKDTRSGLWAQKNRRPFSTFFGSGQRGDGGPGRALKGTARGAMVARWCSTGVPHEGMRATGPRDGRGRGLCRHAGLASVLRRLLVGCSPAGGFFCSGFRSSFL